MCSLYIERSIQDIIASKPYRGIRMWGNSFNALKAPKLDSSLLSQPNLKNSRNAKSPS